MQDGNKTHKPLLLYLYALSAFLLYVFYSLVFMLDVHILVQTEKDCEERR